MKFFAALAIFLAAVLTQARAQQNPDDQYVAIYNSIQAADSTGDLAGYIAAQAALEKFQKLYPDWNPKIVGFRLEELSKKIAALTAQIPPTNTPPQTDSAPSTVSATNVILPTPVVNVESQLRAQVQSLQVDNATLAAKLKEALAVQPASVDPRELEKAQAQIESLMKENDLLKANLAQNNQPSPTATQSPPTNSVPASTNDVVETLRARLAVDEAQAVPYSPEELALLKQPESPPTNSAAQEMPISELPVGSAQLVAEAQNYFASKEYDKARADYLEILRRDPNNALVLANLSAIEMQEGKLDDAEAHITAAVAQNPNDAYDVSLLGYLKFRQQKFDEALDALSRAAKLDPQNPQIQNYLGVTLSHKGLRAQAENALRRAIEIDPDYGPAHNNLAVVYINQQPPAAALARWHYQKALDLGQPRNPDLEKLLADNGAPVNPQ